MRLLLSKSPQHEDIIYASKLLTYFVTECEMLYGDEISIYNFHMLTHIADYSLIHGSLDLCSAFKFENYLGNIKKMTATGNKPLQQIIARLEERTNIKTLQEEHDVKHIIKINDVYINDNKYYKIIYIIDNTFKCIVYKIEHLFLYPRKSSYVGIYKPIR